MNRAAGPQPQRRPRAGRRFWQGLARQPVASCTLLALVLRLIAVGLLNPPARLFPDEREYLLLARSTLLSSYPVPGSPPPLKVLLTTRPPLYPAYLAALGGGSAALLIQAALGAGTVALLTALAQRSRGRRAAWWAGLFLGLDPVSILYTACYLSEVLFAGTLVLALFLWSQGRLRPSSEGSWLRAGSLGLLFGLPAVCRPIGLWIGPLFVPSPLRAPGRAGAFLLGWALPTLLWGGWVLHATGSPPLAHLGARNLVLFRAAPILSRLEGISPEEAGERLGFPEHPSAGRAIGILAKHPGRALEEMGAGLARISFGSGWGSLISRRGEERGASPAGVVPPRRALHPVDLLVALWCLLAYTAALAGFLRPPRNQWRLAATVALLLLLPAGGEGYSRFRVPAWPVISLLAAAGLARRRPEEFEGTGRAV
jgi:4-amino-4-deoxy-L-arabinose transferase-like glycosyltransferase